jgi:hypothetical protein
MSRSGFRVESTPEKSLVILEGMAGGALGFRVWGVGFRV